jgi:hypothetical protein
VDFLGEKIRNLLLNHQCVHKVSTKIIMRKLNDTEIFVDEVETQLREKTTPGQPNPGYPLFRRQS